MITKGRGFREETAAARNNRMSDSFNSLDSDGGPVPERSIEGCLFWLLEFMKRQKRITFIMLLVDMGQIKNLHLNLDCRTGFVKGYAMIEYETFGDAQKAIAEMDGGELLTQSIAVDWAFSRGPYKRRNTRRSPRGRRSRSPRSRF